jgi:hypothetical protein
MSVSRYTTASCCATGWRRILESLLRAKGSATRAARIEHIIAGAKA